MTRRRFTDRMGRERVYLTPDEYARQRARARRARLPLADACARASLPRTAFARWSTGAATPTPDAWEALDRVLREAEKKSG